MSDEEKTEMVEEKKEEQKAEKTEKGKKPTIEELQKEIESLNRSLTNKTEEASRVHEKLTKFEQAEEEKRLAELSETEKLQNQITEKSNELTRAQQELEQLKLDNQKREIANEVGLPAEFALRIKGATPEEMGEDAKSMLDAMSKKAKPNLKTTNPGPNALSDTETREERLKRLGLAR